MSNKYYAVKIGRKPGIYNTWDDCKKQVNGYSGAVYKSFSDVSEAKVFIGKGQKDSNLESSDIIAYVDGSYDDEKKVFSYGIVIIIGENEVHLARKFENSEPEMVEMRNVAGEIAGARKAMEYCLENGYNSIDIYHDYEGIAKWCNGEWKANKIKTQEYREYFTNIKDTISIRFFKVKGHSGDKYNDLADELAKNAILGNDVHEDLSAKISVYMDKDNLNSLIEECGTELWKESFKMIDYSTVGQAERLTYSVSGTQLKIDFFFRKDGSVTIKSVGSQNITSKRLIEKIESKCFKNKHENASCTFENISDDVFDKLLFYFNEDDRISVVSDEEKDTSPKHRAIQCKSKFGDKLFIRHYENKSVLIQGNPAYIFSQLMYFMSIQDEITEENINARQKEIYKSSISVLEARNILKERIPNAYDKLDEEIKKILSPSISLSNSNIEVEEYSCYVFPVLKGLEALLLKLLLNKSILIDHAAPKGSGKYKNFGAIFEKDNNSQIFKLRSNFKNIISDSVYELCVEDIYNYIVGSRHVYFHANQILMLTRMIFDKSEADAILSDVFELIENISAKIL